MRSPEFKIILLIDDDELSRAVLALHLSAAGYDVTEAESGEAAVALLNGATAGNFDLVLSDLQMPGLHGPELAKQLKRATGGTVPVLAMSGSKPLVERYAGFDGFLLKPFTPEQLAEAVGGLCDESGTGSAAAEATAVLDEATFAQLEGMMRPAQMSEIFGLALAELGKHRSRMQAAFEVGDAPVLQASAHAMKGGFSILGALEMRDLGARLEQGGGTAADQAATLDEIPLAAERLRRMLTSRGLQV